MRTLLLATILLAGCHDYGVDIRQPGKMEIQRVFLHNPGSGSKDFPPQYSVMTVDQNKTVTVHSLEKKAVLIADVPKGEPMWMEWTPGPTFYIHVHDLSEVGGGEYRVGKSSHNKTNVVE